MGHLGADVHDAGRGGQDIEVFGKTFPTEIDAFRQNGFGNIFHAFHQVDQIALMARADGREADAAIAENGRCHAMP